MTFHIRQGEAKDIPGALQLIKELAEYEKAPTEVSVTVEEMLREGFGPDPIFRFFVAELDQQMVGLALYYMKYSTWKGRCVFLEDIVVNEQYRGKGIGAGLFEAVARVSAELGVRRMEWQVLEWNEPAIRFYHKYNATLDPEWINGKLSFDQLKQFSTLKSN